MLTPEQEEERRPFIGGSDAASVCGISQYGTPLSLYNRIKGIPFSDSNTKKNEIAKKLGKILEPFIIENFQERTSAKVLVTPSRCVLKHPDYYFLRGNLDGVICPEVLFEAKSARISDKWGEELTADIPLEYLCQIYHYMSLNKEFQSCQACVFFKDKEEFRIYEVPRNEGIINKITEKEIAFWENHVMKNIPPAPSNLEELKWLYPKSNGTSISACGEHEIIIESLKNVKKEISLLEKKADDLKKNLQEYMRENEILNDGNKILATWKNVTSNRFDSNLFKEEMPDLYKQYMRQSQSRMFLVK